MKIKCVFRFFQFIFLVSFALFSSTTNAGTPKAGEEFRGGSKVEYPDGGVSFVLPSAARGFASKSNPDHEMFVSIEPYTLYAIQHALYSGGAIKV